jgi:hypothetical protein
MLSFHLKTKNPEEQSAVEEINIDMVGKELEYTGR